MIHSLTEAETEAGTDTETETEAETEAEAETETETEAETETGNGAGAGNGIEYRSLRWVFSTVATPISSTLLLGFQLSHLVAKVGGGRQGRVATSQLYTELLIDFGIPPSTCL
eukprot:SAG31_NODE_7049_length_1803_cov_390.134977_2_plen_113_part_00